MPNHYHFVVECPRDSSSRALHRVNGLYAQGFNAKYRRSGHLWGDRFAPWQVRDDGAPRGDVRVLLANPVRAGLVLDAAMAVELEPLRRAASTRELGTPASACETGQFFFASSAASRNPSASSPGTRPRTVRARSS